MAASGQYYNEDYNEAFVKQCRDLAKQAVEAKDIKQDDIQRLHELGHRFLFADKVPADYPLAIQCFETALKALEISPDNASLQKVLNKKLGEAYRGLANLDYKSGNHTEAAANFKKAAELGNQVSAINYSHICCAKGKEHFDHERYPQAFTSFQEALKTNHNPEALFYLGYIYLYALGQTRKLDQTKELWQWAAELGHPVAAYDLACLHLRSTPIEIDEEKFPQNLPEAEKYCRRADELGAFNTESLPNPFGLFNKENVNTLRVKLGDAFYRQRQYFSAHEWYQQALHSNLVSPKDRHYLNYQLALLYEQGLGVKKDRVAASLFFRRALEAITPGKLPLPLRTDAVARLNLLYETALRQNRFLISTKANEEIITIIYHATLAFYDNPNPNIGSTFRLIVEHEGQFFDKLLRQEPADSIAGTLAIIGSMMQNNLVWKTVEERNIQFYKKALSQASAIAQTTTLPFPLVKLIIDMAFYEPHFAFFGIDPRNISAHIPKAIQHHGAGPVKSPGSDRFFGEPPAANSPNAGADSAINTDEKKSGPTPRSGLGSGGNSNPA